MVARNRFRIDRVDTILACGTASETARKYDRACCQAGVQALQILGRVAGDNVNAGMVAMISGVGIMEE